MNTNLIFEFYNEHGDWIELNKLQYGNYIKTTTYLGDLNDRIVRKIVNDFRDDDQFENDYQLYSQRGFELLDINCYVEYRSNVVIIFVQYKFKSASIT